MTGQSMMAFIACVEQLAFQLRDFGTVITPAQMMSKIIISLPESYRFFVSAWDSVPAAEKNMALLTARLLKEERMTRIYESQQPANAAEIPVADPNSSALVVKGPASAQQFGSCYPERDNQYQRDGPRRGRGNFRGRGRGRGDGRTRTCFYCQMPGHVIGNCRNRLKDQQRGQSNNNNRNQEFGYTSVTFETRRY